MKASALLLAGVMSVAAIPSVLAQSIPAPAGSADSGARARVAITPVDLSGYATNTYVNSVANTANNAYSIANTANNTANTANNTANSAYSNANSAYNLANSAYYGGAGKIVGTSLGMVSGDGGWQQVSGLCVTGFSRPWYEGWGYNCPAGSGWINTMVPTITPP